MEAVERYKGLDGDLPYVERVRRRQEVDERTFASEVQGVVVAGLDTTYHVLRRGDVRRLKPLVFTGFRLVSTVLAWFSRPFEPFSGPNRRDIGWFLMVLDGSRSDSEVVEPVEPGALPGGPRGVEKGGARGAGAFGALHAREAGRNAARHGPELTQNGPAWVKIGSKHAEIGSKRLKSAQNVAQTGRFRPYLKAVMRETHRFSSPSALFSIRFLEEDMPLAGYEVPKGTRVVMCTEALQKDLKSSRVVGF